jgi:hypothetical protein
MKVALCFIISYQHILNKEQLWINWIKENKDIINVYFHYKDINQIQSPWIKMHTIPPKYVHQTTYYSVVPAYMALLSYAFHHDLENKWFCMLTDSCVPIISPAKFRQLFFENYRASIFKWKPAYWNITIHRRANLRLLKKEYWLANDPWFTLSRAHVHKCILFLVAKNDIYRQVNSGGLANESIFAIMLQTFNELSKSSSLINAVNTVTDWSRMSSPTSPYVFKEATTENINIIINLLKENPHVMFLRKVDSSFPDQAILDLYGNENSSLVNEIYQLYDGCIIPIYQGYFLCIISCIHIVTFLYAFKQNQFFLSIFPFIVFFTSINYWRKPMYDWRRNTDIICVLTALSTHILHSFKAQNRTLYSYITTIALLFYPISWYLLKNKYVWSSTIAHSMIHIVAEIANVILYSGEIPSLSIW